MPCEPLSIRTESPPGSTRLPVDWSSTTGSSPTAETCSFASGLRGIDVSSASWATPCVLVGTVYSLPSAGTARNTVPSRPTARVPPLPTFSVGLVSFSSKTAESNGRTHVRPVSPS